MRPSTFLPVFSVFFWGPSTLMPNHRNFRRRWCPFGTRATVWLTSPSVPTAATWPWRMRIDRCVCTGPLAAVFQVFFYDRFHEIGRCGRVLKSIEEYWRVLKSMKEYWRVLKSIEEYWRVLRVLKSIEEYHEIDPPSFGLRPWVLRHFFLLSGSDANGFFMRESGMLTVPTTRISPWNGCTPRSTSRTGAPSWGFASQCQSRGSSKDSFPWAKIDDLWSTVWKVPNSAACRWEWSQNVLVIFGSSAMCFLFFKQNC